MTAATRVAAIVNPAAGAGRAARRWPEVERSLRDVYGDRLEVHFTRGPGDAIALAERVARDGVDAVLAAGGDGTIHEVINGLMAVAARPALGVLPIGSGNDYVRSLGLPADPLAAARGLAGAGRRRVDVGEVETPQARRYFANMAGVGFDAEVAAEVNRAGKALGGGALPYVLGVLRTLITYRNAPLTIELDGEVRQQTALLCAVGVGAYAGGGMYLVPGADPADGLFDLCIAGDTTRGEVLWLLPRVFSGAHVDHPKVTRARARQVRVEGPTHLHVYADGEVLGNLPARFTLHPGALEVLVPAQPPAA